jgi:hypothetical protein
MSIHIKTIKILLCSFSLVLFFLTIAQPVKALSQPPTVSATCGDPSAYSATLSLTQPLNGGTFYVKLPPVTGATPVKLYTQPIFGNQNCTLLTSVNANNTTWTNAGSLSVPEQAGSIIAQGATLGTEPYEASLDLLYIPESITCTSVTVAGCGTIYNGHKGTISPTLLSSSISQIALYTVKSIQGVPFRSANYYDNGLLMYSSSKLEVPNLNYLAGGNHQVSTVVNLKNGEQFTINETINRGKDYTGTLALRSYAYRHKHVSVLIGTVLGITLLIILAIFSLRLVVAKHKENDRHFGENYHYKNKVDTEEDDEHIVVSSGR